MCCFTVPCPAGQSHGVILIFSGRYFSFKLLRRRRRKKKTLRRRGEPAGIRVSRHNLYLVKEAIFMLLSSLFCHRLRAEEEGKKVFFFLFIWWSCRRNSASRARTEHDRKKRRCLRVSIVLISFFNVPHAQGMSFCARSSAKTFDV